MKKNFNLHIFTPDKDFFNGPAECVVITAVDGEIGILPGRAPLVVALVAAPLALKTADGWQRAAVSGGFVSVRGAEVMIFADAAEWPDDIEESRAMEAKRRAEERLRARGSEVEFMRSRVALQRALTRLAVKQQGAKSI